MLDPRLLNLRPVTTYARLRIFLVGLVRFIFGFLILGCGVAVAWAAANGDMAPNHPGDMPSWWMVLVGCALALFGFGIASGGGGRMVLAFASGCCFLAGPEGVYLRMPKLGWFGLYSFQEHSLQWNQIEALTHFTQRINLIPVSRELRIRVYGGQQIVVPRYFFSASVKRNLARMEQLRIGQL
jgi:hypothetical protein